MLPIERLRTVQWAWANRIGRALYLAEADFIEYGVPTQYRELGVSLGMLAVGMKMRRVVCLDPRWKDVRRFVPDKPITMDYVVTEAPDADA